MIGQSLGSVYLSWEALSTFTPLFYFDSSGYAFTYPIARLFGCKVICYTHYPTISSDMVSRVRDRKLMYNNDSQITGRYASKDVVNFFCVIYISVFFYDLDTWACHYFLDIFQLLQYVSDNTLPVGSIWRSKCKVIYYTVLTWMYGWVGSCAHLAMVNSSWTKSHLEGVWNIPGRILRVYPPCDTSALQVVQAVHQTSLTAGVYVIPKCL